jgi:hypothetical protein
MRNPWPLRSDGVSEKRAVVAPLQPVLSGFLLGGPARRQFIKSIQDVVDNGAPADRRTHHLVSPALQRRKKLRQSGGLQNEWGADGRQVGNHSGFPRLI